MVEHAVVEPRQPAGVSRRGPGRPSTRLALVGQRMRDGWGPLCDFLEKPVPDVQFPWVNESAELRLKFTTKVRLELLSAAKLLMPWIVGLGFVGVGSWWVTNGTLKI